jgi:hypothetical protein
MLAVALGENQGWWRVPKAGSSHFRLELWLAFAVSCTPVYLISWRAARRFGGRGLAVFALAAEVIGPARDYQVAAMFPDWITFSPGVAPILWVRTWLNRKLGKERRGQLHREFQEHAHRPREQSLLLNRRPLP